MSSNATRAATLTAALRASIEGDVDAVEQFCADDVTTWTPAMATSSLAELRAVLSGRDDAFSEIELDPVPLDVGGDHACVEWSVTMTHTGALELAGGVIVEPTGLRISLHGVSIAEFRDERICSLRQYWDEVGALEQLGLLGPGETGAPPGP